MALAVIEAGECPGCHGNLAETTSLASDDDWDVNWNRCNKCSAIHEMQEKAVTEKWRQVRALLWTAVRRRT